MARLLAVDESRSPCSRRREIVTDRVNCIGCGRTVIKDRSFKCRHCKTVTYFSANFTTPFLVDMLEGLGQKVILQKK